MKHCFFARGASLALLGIIFLSAARLDLVSAPLAIRDAFGSAIAYAQASPPAGGEEERRALESQLEELEKQIEEHEAQIAKYKAQGKTLSGEIATLNAKIAKAGAQIKALNLELSRLTREINETQRQINRTEDNIGSHKDAIGRYLRDLYESDRADLVEVVLSQEELSDFFGYIENVTLVQENLRISLAEITRLREDLVEQKEHLATKKDDTENLRAVQEGQKKNVEAAQAQKNQLLKTTKGKESEYQKLLTKTQASAAQIRTRIFQLLGGGELTFEAAYDFARIAEGATGVRAALTLAILHRESLLGKNVGRCSYAKAMHPTRDKPYFLELLGRLGIDPSSDFAKVSCPNAHGAYGGAMGPAQFIPSTWKLYESKIAAVTGNNPPSPWNNADAFAATAVYMKDLLGSSSCKSYAEANKNQVSYQTLVERCAAAKYYSGGNWYTYRFWYGDPVVTKANEFEQDISVLKANAAVPASLKFAAVE
ncbi:MAG: lytic murein transglycosylase [Candidatus Brennerbacteria bacterium]|nr:lytic murein transglycosylase [Candidatus Brennerbacteria bacterium]